ncbi:CaiB/BaiF CoA-transferase family protein [Kineosporia babensis]|uniref:CoA transferase n=1 Tax=Kineosporia babensis TaxID=499548 RepID=A0A9X1NHK4_9ACTN|nr:CoA transferase [Kineosporia babensis]MCD5314009.1 CoA transferase [Kineosporia babensis]
MSASSTSLPLERLRVLDLTEGAAESCGQLLADLGADVLRVEPPGGSAGRAEPIGWALRNNGKCSLDIDLSSSKGRRRLNELLAEADLLLRSEGGIPQTDAHPHLVVVTITDFGLTGPRRDWQATEATLAAAGGVLCRSGLPGRAPLLPPEGLVAQTVGVHAAWAALVAFVKRLRTGRGEQVDVSALEAVVHGFDPGFGTQGSAAAGRAQTFPRDRPDAANFYPVFACADGHVRICLLARRQWRAMFAWLGEPEEFADERYDTIPARFAASDRLNPLIAKLFAGRTRAELVQEGVGRGIPMAGVLSVAEVLQAEHFRETGALAVLDLEDGTKVMAPAGSLRVNGRRAASPPPSESAITGFRQPRRPFVLHLPPQTESEPPLVGLRVLDLGVIVFGAELTRLFADQGADVIKVENPAFPDGLRQTRKGGGMNPSFAWGGRNKRGLSLDLRANGEQFRQLVARADLVTANFKPGTLDSLGLSYDRLSKVNPRIVVSESSAFGRTGPWREHLGYGPLVRAACGVTSLWRDPDDPDSFCDGSTVYPDHIAGHLAAVGSLAALIGRDEHGYEIGLAQVDVALAALGPTLAGVESDSSVFPCAGQDEWCVISVRGYADRAALQVVTGASDRSELTEWTRVRTPAEVTQLLQKAGVPAAGMARLPELLEDEQLVARDSFHELEHPQLRAPVPTGARIARFSSIPDPPLRPAPMPGEHTDLITAELLGSRLKEESA